MLCALSFYLSFEPVVERVVLCLKGMAADEAEDLLADETAFMGTKGVTSTAIVGGSNGKPLENSWTSPRGGK